jgi:hypothetical protein
MILLLACAGPGEDTAIPTFVPDEMTLGDAVRCDSPVPLGYDEVGEQMGLLGGPDPKADHHHGGSLAVDDLDGDGDYDVVMGWPTLPPQLYTRDGDTFTVSDIDAGPTGVFLLNLADIDQDGDPDLLVPGYKLKPQVLRNDGGTFVDVPLPSLGDSETAIRELAPGDVDGDGFPDLYAVANRGSDDPERRRDLLLRGAGDGTFTLDTAAATTTGRGFDAVWFDADADGDQDVYVVNDDGADYGGNQLFHSEGGQLVDATDSCACGVVHFGMGGDVGDFNADGLPDLYLSAVAHSVLLEGFDDGTWADVSLAIGADPIPNSLAMGWGDVFLDHDNDGRVDVLLAQGDRWNTDKEEDEVISVHYDASADLLAQDADGRFSDVAPAFGLDTIGSWRSVVALDDNGDGVLDLLVSDTVNRPRWYMSQGCTEAGWLEVEAPVHSRVELTIAGRTQTAWVTTESSYGAGRPPLVHFGTGDASRIDSLVVTPPGGEPIEATGIDVRRRVSVE